jgi:hypothetical protein
MPSSVILFYFPLSLQIIPAPPHNNVLALNRYTVDAYMNAMQLLLIIIIIPAAAAANEAKKLEQGAAELIS